MATRRNVPNKGIDGGRIHVPYANGARFFASLTSSVIPERKLSIRWDKFIHGDMSRECYDDTKSNQRHDTKCTILEVSTLRCGYSNDYNSLISPLWTK